MQERAVQPEPAGIVASSPVGPIPEDRMPDGSEVHPDLVRPTRPGNGLQQGRAGKTLADLEPGLGRPSLGGVHDDLGRAAAE